MSEVEVKRTGCWECQKCGHFCGKTDVNCPHCACDGDWAGQPPASETGRCKWCTGEAPEGQSECERCRGTWVCPICSRVNDKMCLYCLWCGEDTEGKSLLHLGAGTRKLPGYTSVDIRPEVEPDVVADIERLDGFKNASADIIYAAHVLEHIPGPHVITVLEEWRRVLKPGGTLRLSVPDFRVLAELYLCEGVSMWRITGPLHGRQDYEANTHFISFDYEYLAWMLGTAGYHDIRRWYPAEVHPKGYDDISLAKIDGQLISLNVEATA